MADNLFTVEDSDGVSVHLSIRVWRSHILSRHGRMRMYADHIKAVIASPSRKYANTAYQTGVSYWKKGMGGPRDRDLWLTVVVNYKQSRIRRQPYGEVLTAYFTPTTPPEDERIFENE